MRNVLKCIAEHYIWLFECYEFRISNSEYHPSFGGQGLVELENASVRLRFVSDREKVFLEFGPKHGWRDDEAASVDLVCWAIEGEYQGQAILTDSLNRFVRQRFDAIIELFSENGPDKLRSIFKTLKNQRSKMLFG